MIKNYVAHQFIWVSSPLVTLLIANSALADIVIDWRNQKNSGFNAAQKSVLKQAISQWERIIHDLNGLPGLDAFNLTLTLSNNDPDIFIAGADMFMEDANQLPTSARILIDPRDQMLFVDPTPKSHTEFLNTEHDWYGGPKKGSPAEGKIDLLTVIKHELGHALGFAEPYRLWDMATNDATGRITYGDMMNAQAPDLNGDGIYDLNELSHLDHPTHPFNLMASADQLPTGGKGDRRAANRLDLDILVGIYGYEVHQDNLKRKIPAPGTISILALAGLTTRKRRRR